jgi:hypothetical protein
VSARRLWPYLAAFALGLVLGSSPVWAENKLALNTGYEHFADIVFATGFVAASGSFEEIVSASTPCAPTGEVRGTDGTFEEIVTLTLDTTDEIACGDNAAWDGFATATVACLVRNAKAAIAATGTEYVIAKDSSTGAQDAWRVFMEQDEDFASIVTIGGVATTSTYTAGLGGGISSSWNFVGFTYDGSTLTSRVNTSEAAGTAVTGSITAGDGGLFIGDGEAGSGASNAWDGDLAMCVILDVALDATDWDALVSDPLQIFAADAGGSAVTVISQVNP